MDLSAKLKNTQRAQRQRHQSSEYHRTKKGDREGQRARKSEEAHFYVLWILKDKHQYDDQDQQCRK